MLRPGWSAPSEAPQALAVPVSVRGPQGGQVLVARNPRVGQLGSCTPGESILPKRFDEHIGSEARVATVAVREGMDGHETVMEPDRHLVR